jgi:CHAD domain-containing protein
MLEEERKFAVGAGFEVPDLTGCLPSGGRVVPRPPMTLRATYYDTADLRLARAGVSLRYRRGEAPAGGRKATGTWTAKLPTETTGIRQEISRPGPATAPPAELVGLLTAYHRGDELVPATTMRTVRRVYDLRDRQDRLLAEVSDDSVSVVDGRRTAATFREVEVERGEGSRKLLDKVGALLCKAGAAAGEFTPKHVRAMGPAASVPPDLVAPGLLPRKPSAGEVVTTALRRDIARIIEHDPLVRLRDPLPDGDTPVHQMRVGTRRLRSDLRTFGPLLDKDWAGRLRTELGWIADVLGAARDAEVLRDRLRHTAAADPLAPPDAAAVARIDADLTARHEEALLALDEALASDRYLALLDLLLDAARKPRLTGPARKPAREALPTLVGRPWRRLVRGGPGVYGAGDLDATAPDDDWHAVRVNGKRARYAADAVADVIGGSAPALAKALGSVQNLLGEHQDAAVAAETWLAIALADPDDHALAVTAGRLYERERAAVRAARDAFPQAWEAASQPRLTDWLPR